MGVLGHMTSVNGFSSQNARYQPILIDMDDVTRPQRLYHSAPKRVVISTTGSLDLQKAELTQNGTITCESPSPPLPLSGFVA